MRSVISDRPVQGLSIENLRATPEEPLAESARVAWAEAPHRCSRNPQIADTCLPYHRVWQYLRLLGINSSTRTNTNFLLRAFRECARTARHPLALISATADYSMLAHLRCAYSIENALLRATVVDRCDTPLFLNQWYGARYQLPLTTTRADILEYVSDHPFDLVCTHNFLGFYDADVRRRIVARWRTLLRPGGVVVTTQRIQPNMTSERNSFGDGEARELSLRAGAIAQAHLVPLDFDVAEFVQAVHEYALRKRTYVIRTTGEITDLFETEGFDIELADGGGGPEERALDRPACLVGTDSFRMRIIARRR